jgi:uncharacterized membrane protein YgdD (TMEM256/DUF423 family)
VDRLWIGAGSLVGVTAVAMAALAAHALGGLDAQAMGFVQSGLQMQGWHALALVLTGVWAARGGLLAHLAGASFLAGVLLFCGAVYALALDGLHLGVMAPTGGWLLMLGWVLLGVSALRAR